MILASTGRERTNDDGCRRYMPIRYTFDTRNVFFEHEEEHGNGWEPDIREQWRRNQRQITVGLVSQFGAANFDTKFNDYRALGVSPMTVVALHNAFLDQVRNAFVAGAYYPALVGAGALGERILNWLVIVLRDDYQDHAATTSVIANRESFNNWRKCFEALAAWGVLSDELVANFTRLEDLRHDAVHYGPGLDKTDAREPALDAVRLLQDIIAALFAPFGGPPRFIEGTSGQSFLSLESETLPLIRHFYLPACVLVSPRYRAQPVNRADAGSWFDIYDDGEYQERYRTLSDAEFAEHCKDIRRFWPEDQE